MLSLGFTSYDMELGLTSYEMELGYCRVWYGILVWYGMLIWYDVSMLCYGMLLYVSMV